MSWADTDPKHALLRGERMSAVLIAEPHPICRLALARLIASSDRLSVAAETGDLDSAPDLAHEIEPAVVLLSVETAADLARVTRFPRMSRVLVLAALIDGETIFSAVRAGAQGVVPKRADPKDILTSLEQVSTGETVIHHSLTTGALKWAAENEEHLVEVQTRVNALTPRERQVTGLLAAGLRPRSIAERMFLSRRTVEWYLSNIYRKLGATGRIEALIALRRLLPTGLADLEATGSRSA